MATNLLSEIFNAKHVDLRPLSGHVAGAAALLALCRPGDTVMELDKFAGSHRLAEKLNLASLIDLNVVAIPFDAVAYNIDIEATIEAIKQYKPRVVILGTSLMLNPQPVAALAEVIKSIDNCWLMYDASHVLGLIAEGTFQQPLAEGADLIVTSTHKTFAGPQGGMILTNNDELASKIAISIYPALVTNHHLARIPAMAARALEIKAFGNAYSTATVRNAKTLAKALHDNGLNVVGSSFGFTQSHTIAFQTSGIGKSKDISLLLEQANIICGEIALPIELGSEAIRLGVQELTRLGLEPSDTNEIASVIAGVVLNKIDPIKARKEVKEIAARFTALRYALG